MNVMVTRFADGIPRRAFSVADCLRMQEAGIIGPEERYELIEGEIVPMQANSHPHERIKLALNRALARYLPDDLQLGVETSCFLGDKTFVNPDLSVFPMRLPTDAVRGHDLLLAIEVGFSTIAFDRGRKAELYAKYGVRELWVIDAASGIAAVNTEPTPDRGYRAVREVPPDRPLVTASLPGFVFRIADVP